MKFLAASLVAIGMSTASAFANIPGGGNGTGANVTITTNTGASTITMANGIVTAVINYHTSQILQLTYLGHQITAGGISGTSAFYRLQLQ